MVQPEATLPSSNNPAPPNNTVTPAQAGAHLRPSLHTPLREMDPRLRGDAEIYAAG
jgi:hypothetical protein